MVLVDILWLAHVVISVLIYGSMRAAAIKLKLKIDSSVLSTCNWMMALSFIPLVGVVCTGLFIVAVVLSIGEASKEGDVTMIKVVKKFWAVL